MDAYRRLTLHVQQQRTSIDRVIITQLQYLLEDDNINAKIKEMKKIQ